MFMYFRLARIGAVLLMAVTPAFAETTHPLDPLSAGEITRAITVIAASGRVNKDTRAPVIRLKEPDKSDIRAWQPGEPMARMAEVILRVSGETIEVDVDLATDTMIRWEAVPGAQPRILSSEWQSAQAAVKSDPRWQEAMRARGYETFDEIFCESLSSGHFGNPAQSRRRLMKLPCFDTRGTETNIYARPIEGLVATVDLDTRDVLDVLDEGIIAIPSASHEFAVVSQPAVQIPPPPTISADGRLVKWGNWQFHLGFDPLFGTILSLVEFEDAGIRREILYQAHVSEVFVPYMDPRESWAFRTYMDAGEYGLGVLASSLTPGIDCPSDALFLDEMIASPTGKPILRERAVCIFEHQTGKPGWRHAEAYNGAYSGIAGKELVVRSIPSIAHYDYAMDWVFSPGGQIEMRIGATGVDAVRAAESQKATDKSAQVETVYGSLVAPGLVAINHDHYFSLRLDFDIDGESNRFQRERIVQDSLPEKSSRRSLWRVIPETIEIETALKAMHSPQVWRIENAARTTALGHHPGYQIQGVAPTSLLSAEDWPQRRAAFSGHNLWITAYRPGERHAGGRYPNQSTGGAGLPGYLDGDAIDGADLVVWYTVGFRHVSRPEDWPILSTVWQSVRLRPYRFFDQNPSVPVQ
ncbi:copper amine oxidase [Leisingera caerulea]|uniref:Amine oxidase n=1 Tax=Leisingera caerulea TaxID=506591 RepID=A0A9Q9HN03_LEICA|nr:hypothetical protein [Leisingera caerulea]UWQ55954.1 hypothetical protein K3721_19160 [Leisingera caerulea]